jgi:hypothetical protein
MPSTAELIKVKPKRGGKREGAGRPKAKKSFSDKLKTDVMKHLQKKAKEGDTYGKLLVDLAFSKDEVHSLRGIALKLIAEVLVVKETKSTVEEKKGPVVYLPEVKPKPKELIVLAKTGEKQD